MTVAPASPRRALLYAHPGALWAWGLVLLGALLDLLAIPPGPAPLLVLVADVPFLWLVTWAAGARWKRWAFLYGVVHFGLGLHWLVHVTPFQVVGAGLALGLVYLLAAAALRLLIRRRVPWLLAVPTVLVFEEMFRVFYLGGMPWPSRSLSFVALLDGALVPSVAYVGSYGLVFLAGLANAVVACTAWAARQAPAARSAAWTRVVLSAFVPALLAALLVVLAVKRVRAAEDADAWITTDDSVLVAVQGNISQSLKHSPDQGAPMQMFQTHLDLTQQALRYERDQRRHVMWVLWPETMVPWAFLDAELANRFPELWENEIRVLHHLRGLFLDEEVTAAPHLLIGALYEFRRGEERHSRPDRYGEYDSLFHLDPEALPDPRDVPPPPPSPGETPAWELGRHDKHIRVPGGEYTPLGEILTPLRFFRSQVSEIPELDQGKADQELFPLFAYYTRPTEGHTSERIAPPDAPQVAWIRAGTANCFELLFPGHCRRLRAAGANVLLNPANYGWFGPSAFRSQIRAAAALRAAEGGMNVVMAGNTGPTGFWDPLGRPYGRFHDVSETRIDGLSEDARTYLAGWAAAPLRVERGAPPYVRWGDLGLFLVGGLAILLALLGRGGARCGIMADVPSGIPAAREHGENL